VAQGEAAAGPRAYLGFGGRCGAVQVQVVLKRDQQLRQTQTRRTANIEARLGPPARAACRGPRLSGRQATGRATAAGARRQTAATPRGGGGRCSRLALAEAAGAAAPAGAWALPFEAVVAKAIACPPPAPAIRAGRRRAGPAPPATRRTSLWLKGGGPAFVAQGTTLGGSGDSGLRCSGVSPRLLLKSSGRRPEWSRAPAPRSRLADYRVWGCGPARKPLGNQ
jgi:hypothetical protein